VFKSGPFPPNLFASLPSLQEAQVIFETILYLSLIGLVGAIVKAVAWLREARQGPAIRRGYRRG
jgi:hypothetical protein